MDSDIISKNNAGADHHSMQSANCFLKGPHRTADKVSCHKNRVDTVGCAGTELEDAGLIT